MEILRTPEESFKNLPDYPFVPNYLEVAKGLQMHYVDAGDPQGEVVLLLHGEPSWSYLYRKMIPIFAAQGYRVLAPDLIGFGKSDKPSQTSDYTYAHHLAWLEEFLNQMELSAINVFCQDWGGLLGLRLIAKYPDKFARVVVGNTILPTGDAPLNEAFLQWQKYSQEVPVFPVGQIIQQATVTDLSPEVIAAYDAPFPEENLKAGARVFPALVPTSPDDPESPANREAWKILAQWQKPFLTLFSDSDPIMSGLEKIFQEKIPGAKGQNHSIIAGGGHFLQEDKGEEIAEKMIDFMQNT